MTTTQWMTWDSRPLPDELQAFVRAMDDEADTIVDEIFMALQATMPIYITPAAIAQQDGIRQATSYFVRSFHQALLEGHSPLTPELLNVVAQYVRQRLLQNMTLGDLLRARQLCGHVHWAMMLQAARSRPELCDEMLHKVSRNMLCCIDAHCQVAYQVYNTEEKLRTRWREQLRTELCAVLLSRPDDIETFRAHAQALLLDDAAPHCALAVRLVASRKQGAQSAESFDHLVELVGRHADIEAETFVRTPYQGHLLMWLPMPHGLSVLEGDRRFAELAASVALGDDAVEAIGIGLPGIGPRGWRQSARQAMKAIEGGLRLSAEKKVFCYSDIALDDAVTYSENTRRYFESLLARLNGEPNLLQTLRVYFELRQQRKSAAAALGIHPNTLDYRLERITTLLGVGLDDVSWIAKLQIALRLQGSGQDSERTAAM